MLLPALAASVLAANPYLDEGAALFDRMLYERAVPKLKRATEVSASTAAERRRAHDLLARTYAALGQNEEASRTFVALLSVDARAPLPADASPTIRRLFLEAKERLYPRGRAQLRRVAAPPPRVTVELVDPWELVARVELRQSAGEGALEPVVLEPGALLSGEVVPQATSCSVVALAASGEPVASLGPITLSGALTPREPAGATAAPVLTVEEGAPAARPARWPVVVTAAASVALLAAGVALTAAAAGDSSSAAQQRFGADVRRLDDAARDKGIAGAVLLGAAVVGGAATAVIFFAW